MDGKDSILLLLFLKNSHNYVIPMASFRSEPFEIYAAEIQEKTPEDVEKYYNTFVEKWTTLAGES